jgi:hypothetical protein
MVIQVTLDEVWRVHPPGPKISKVETCSWASKGKEGGVTVKMQDWERRGAGRRKARNRRITGMSSGAFLL